MSDKSIAEWTQIKSIELWQYWCHPVEVELSNRTETIFVAGPTPLLQEGSVENSTLPVGKKETYDAEASYNSSLSR